MGQVGQAGTAQNGQILKSAKIGVIPWPNSAYKGIVGGVPLSHGFWSKRKGGQKKGGGARKV